MVEIPSNTIILTFTQPAKDKTPATYVVITGYVEDIACYRSNEITGTEDARKISAHGDKLTKEEFHSTMPGAGYLAKGLSYRS